MRNVHEFVRGHETFIAAPPVMEIEHVHVKIDNNYEIS